MNNTYKFTNLFRVETQQGYEEPKIVYNGTDYDEALILMDRQRKMLGMSHISLRFYINNILELDY